MKSQKNVLHCKSCSNMWSVKGKFTWRFLLGVFLVCGSTIFVWGLHSRCKSFCGNLLTSRHQCYGSSAKYQHMLICKYARLSKICQWLWPWNVRGSLLLKTYTGSAVVSEALISSSINPLDITAVQVCSVKHGGMSLAVFATQPRNHLKQLYLLNLTCICGSVTGSPGALNRGGAFSVGGGACTELPVTTKPEWVHLSRRGCESQRVLPYNHKSFDMLHSLNFHTDDLILQRVYRCQYTFIFEIKSIKIKW